MTDEIELRIRQLCYRLRRQGMLELDAWLEPLVKSLQNDSNQLVVAAAEVLLAEDTPDLLAMMHGDRETPELLRPWLAFERG